MMQKFFFKRWKSFFIIMLIPIIIISIISSVFIYNRSMDSIVQNSGNTLTIIDDNLNIVLSTSAYQYDLLTYNPQLIISLEKLFQQDNFEYTDLIFSKSIKASLNAVAQTHTYVDSIYLYMDDYNVFMSSKDGIIELENAKDKEWHAMYQNSDINSVWIEKRIFQEYAYINPINLLTMFHRMSNVKGVVIVNINIKEFEKVLNNAGEDGTQLLLLDNQNQIICSSNNLSNEITSNQDYFSENFHQFLNTNNIYEANHIVIGSERFLIQALPNSQYGTTLVALVSSQEILIKLLPTMLVMIGAVLSNCIISLLLAYFVTHKNFNQISSIVKTFHNAERGEIPQTQKLSSIANDEYDVILNNVITVFLSNNHLQQQLKEKQYEQKLSEMAALQLQINPHFLFNTLQAIDFEALRLAGEPCTLNRMIQNLSDILKYALGDPMVKVPLIDELNYLRKYADIQQQRLGNKFIIYYEIDDNLLDLPVLRLMLQPLVENSIQHGISALDLPGYIKVRAYQRNNFAYFTVVDSGIGLTKQDIEKLYTRISNYDSEDIGLTNVNRRLVLNYGFESALVIQSKKEMGTSVSFKLPLA